MKNEPSPFGIETEKSHLYCTTTVKRRRTLAALCLILRQHTVYDAKLVDDVALLARRYAHFLEDVPHVDLQFLDAAIARIPSDRTDDGGIQKDKHLKWMLVLLYPMYYVKMCSRCSILLSHSLLESAHSFNSFSTSAFIGRFFL